ncbi:hypothetical protein Ahy_B06g083820 [Arachis hypogaea]|uniref:Disease resistance N-terminal domain-containing protein n=1 Tax=Arachis hypogaea TaxID=3818 RepID=A0A444YQP7_ARAHY|nr:hypothetical protein Ahy_B06g083820 [Arachis hypogaea]
MVLLQKHEPLGAESLMGLFITTDAVNLVLGKKLGPDLVERLKISLLAAEALDNPSVREWLNSLKDAVYVADDLLDAILTKAATRKDSQGHHSYLKHSSMELCFHSVSYFMKILMEKEPDLPDPDPDPAVNALMDHYMRYENQLQDQDKDCLMVLLQKHEPLSAGLRDIIRELNDN